MGTKSRNYVKRFVKTVQSDGVYTNYQIDIVHYNTRTGSVNPYYRSVIKQGGNATNNLTANEMTSSLDQGNLVGKYSSNADYILRDMSVTNPWYYPTFDFRSYIPQAEADNKAITAIHEAVRNAQYAISGPTFAGEFKDTLRLLKRPAEGIRDILTDYVLRNKHLRGKKPTRAINKSLAKQWLEVQFGIRPLLSDTKAAADAVSRLVTGIRRTRVSSGGRSVVADPPVVTHFSPYGYFTVQGVVFYERSCRVTFKVGVRAAVSGQSGYLQKLDEIRQVCGFNLSEFVPTVWELVPFSFVADYFANVGDILTCATTDQSGVVFISKCVRFDNKVIAQGIQKRRLDFHPNGKIAIDIPEQSAGGYQTLYSSVQRGKPSSLGIPSLEFKFPGVGQVTNLAALWAALR